MANKKFNVPEECFIELISDIDFYIMYPNNKYKTNYTGIVVKTNKGNIVLAIEKDIMCCETVGTKFLETPDDIDYFNGSMILSVEQIDILTSGGYEQETQLKVTTDKGVLQYAVYNSHNGSYSHSTIIQILDEKFTGTL